MSVKSVEVFEESTTPWKLMLEVSPNSPNDVYVSTWNSEGKMMALFVVPRKQLVDAVTELQA